MQPKVNTVDIMMGNNGKKNTDENKILLSPSQYISYKN